MFCNVHCAYKGETRAGKNSNHLSDLTGLLSSGQVSSKESCCNCVPFHDQALKTTRRPDGCKPPARDSSAEALISVRRERAGFLCRLCRFLLRVFPSM